MRSWDASQEESATLRLLRLIHTWIREHLRGKGTAGASGRSGGTSEDWAGLGSEGKDFLGTAKSGGVTPPWKGVARCRHHQTDHLTDDLPPTVHHVDLPRQIDDLFTTCTHDKSTVRSSFVFFPGREPYHPAW